VDVLANSILISRVQVFRLEPTLFATGLLAVRWVVVRMEQREVLVAVRSDWLQLTPKRVQQILTGWFATRHPATVAFKEVIKPVTDPYADYSVVYEVVFEPSSLDQACVEFWVTQEGKVSLGLETQKRIAERLGVICRNNRFAAGHEPYRMRETDLLMILELIATGQIAIASTVIPLFGLISTKAVVSHDILERLDSKGYSPLHWLKGLSQTELSKERCFLRFRSWTDSC
jgi:hypothetical protein